MINYVGNLASVWFFYAVAVFCLWLCAKQHNQQNLTVGLSHGKFPEEWKKANVVPLFKKGDKQCVKNYHPVSLLPICSKIFERIIYNNTYNYLIDNNVISQNQLGFKCGDSCIN